jgi:misacylated tRNA(Ala) deacylase
VTELLFREDAYLKSVEAELKGVNERNGLLFDRTVFYPTAGGQPGDKGLLKWDGGSVAIATTVYDGAKNAVHVPSAPDVLPPIGTRVEAELDWANRYRNMRCHTLMHLLCATVPYPVTGSALTEDGGRIDFDIPDGETPKKEELAEKINALILGDHAVNTRWITDEELMDNQHLIRTMSVKPPMGSGRVRLVSIGGDKIDLQPCGGTHVKSTSEIGPIIVSKIESKGKINRRIRLAFA